MKYSSIIPLIGGKILAHYELLNKQLPEYILSYTPFVANDSHILNYFNNEIPYFLLDKNEKPKNLKVDIVSTLCPCAGLSSLSLKRSADNEKNNWMYLTAKFVLEEISPIVFWGENAPAFATELGSKIRTKLMKCAYDNGYTFSIYVTKSQNHGNPQYRRRSFYFFWKGNKVPVFEYYQKPYKKIEDTILEIKSNFQQELINGRTPSKNPWYDIVLNKIHGGVTHTYFMQNILKKSCDVQSYIEGQIPKNPYLFCKEIFKEKNLDNLVKKCEYIHEKLNSGKYFMKREIMLPKNNITAFVGHFPYQMTHPIEDRFLTYREAMSIMGLPENFELLNPKKSVNHICQNVPLQTAKDMFFEILEALKGNRVWLNQKFILQNNLSKTISNISENFFINNQQVIDTLEQYII